MPLLSDSVTTSLLFKKYLGIASTDPAAEYSQESSGSARPKVVPSLQLFKESIPSSVTAGGTLVADLSFNAANAGLSPAPTRSYFSAYPHIVKYENIPLKSIKPWVGYTSDLSGIKMSNGSAYPSDTNLLTNGIPYKFDPQGSYDTYVKDLTSNQGISNTAARYPWIYDTDVGYITFYTGSSAGTKFTQADNIKPVVTTFWRYEGTFVQSTDFSGNTSNVTISNGALGRLVQTLDANGTLQAISGLTYIDNTFDISGSLQINNVTIDTSGNATYKLTLPSALPSTTQFLTSDASGNLSWSANVDLVDAYGYTFKLKDASDNYPTLISNNIDTQSIAISKLDYWLYKHLIDAPPKITNLRVISRTSTDIIIGWDYPIQLEAGFDVTNNGSNLLPNISKLHISYDDNAGVNQFILNNETSQYVIKTSSSSVVATRVRFSRSSAPTALTTLSTGSIIAGDGVGNYIGRFNVSTLKDVSNVIYISYRNNNSDATLIKSESLTFDGFQQVGAPAPTVITSASATSATQIQINTKAGNPDANDTSSTATIQQYKFLYDISSNIDNIIDGGGSNWLSSASFTDLSGATKTFNIVNSVADGMGNSVVVYPNTVYNITAYAKNNLSSIFSDPSNNAYGSSYASVTTPIHNPLHNQTIPAVTLSGTTYSGFNNTTSFKRKVNAPTTDYYNPIFNNSSGNLVVSSDVLSNIGINTLANARSQDSAIINISTNYVRGGTTSNGPTVSYDGFNGTAVKTPNVSAVGPTNGITINASKVKDSYAGTTGYQYYYVDVSEVSFGLSGTAVSASKDDTTFGVFGPGSGNTRTVIYGVDDITGAPDISGTPTLTTSTGVTKITGINILNTTGSTITTTVDATIKNIGHYYFRNPWLNITADTSINAGDSSSFTAGAINEIDLTNVPPSAITNGELANAFAYSRNYSLNLTNTAYSLGAARVLLSAYNLTGGSDLNVQSTQLPFVIDKASLSFINSASYTTSFNSISVNTIANVLGAHCELPTISNQATNMGANFISNSFSYAISALSLYNHSTSNLSGNNTNQAIICKGKFTSVEGSGYVNYSSIDSVNNNGLNLSGKTTSDGYRYVAFGWNINASSSANLNNFTFNFVGLSGSISEVHYRIQRPSDVTKSTPWIRFGSAAGSASIGTWGTLNSDGSAQLRGVYDSTLVSTNMNLGGGQTSVSNGASAYNNMIALVPSLTPTSGDKLFMVVRMNANTTFTGVQITSTA
jgi:hypothetical protein